MYKDVTGIILAGGKSTRMGENKALMRLGGEIVIERVVNLLSPLFPKIVLSTNSSEEFAFLGLPMYPDIFAHRGPLAGIHAGLQASETNQNFIISCDIPLMSAQMVRYIMDFQTEKPVTVCRADGFIQQLAGRYARSMLQIAEQSLADDESETRADNQKHRKCKVLSLLETVGAEIIDAEQTTVWKEGLFLNMNRREEYEKISKLIQPR